APSVDRATARRDLLTIYAVQALRALLYGFASVLVGASLAHAGYSDAKVGLVFTAMLGGFAVTSVAVGTRGDQIGRRRLYAALFLVMAAAGTVFALTRWLPALILAALTGTISVEANESGPITSLEQAMIPQAAEAGDVLTAERRFPLVRSKRKVAGLAGLFAIDSFGGGFVVNSFLVFWFQRKFGASTELMGLVFFFVGLLQSGSSIAAGALANRIGLLNTMVFTHLPSNILLILVPFMPNLWLAIAMLLARFAISQMDVPARQSYVVVVVDPDERT